MTSKNACRSCGPKHSFVRLSNRRWVWPKAIVPTATARNPTNPEIQSGFLRVAGELDGVSPHLSGMPICGGELDGVSPHLSGMPICGGARLRRAFGSQGESNQPQSSDQTLLRGSFSLVLENLDLAPLSQVSEKPF